jgi:5-oxoprolinase (ATP-hydrolysing)
MREAAVEQPLATALTRRPRPSSALGRAACDELLRQASRGSRRLSARPRALRGTDSALALPGSADAIRAAFGPPPQRFAFLMAQRGLIVEAVSVEAVALGDAPSEPRVALQPAQAAPIAETVRLWSGGRWWDAGLVVRESARPGHLIDGPAIIAEQNATTVVEPGWQARVRTTTC